ncbi:HsdM family class I SAM-dependent methyltransferase [Garciella nitratireducens]|uniref:site-specific DNA-methyltransferase (adenine-specific) n=1 Tax=Garciella nitratireducens DSM 15102 TaxID=1121911 RepID=A0A1T4M179_9FIRM|nr:N-6 DNA methylase [Garciella nitratireducens]SJZ60645.1 N-6 DNA Methylase [Garciella nitratireducens DSM 15102]
MGGRTKLTDFRFVVSFGDEEEFRMVPFQSDGQMLFLANNIAKMKHSTPLGSRIVQVHNGSSLFTGNPGSGESNLRRYIIENDYLEAIIALPENMFYNTGIATYVWVLSNRKEDRRKGKIQLIDATSFKKPLRKNLGDKNCEISEELREEIIKMYLDFEENEFSKIFNNEEFGYYEITVERPLRLKVNLSQENSEKLKESLKKNDKYIYDLVLKLKEEEGKEEYLDYNLYIENLEKLAKEEDEKFLARHRKLIQDNLTIADKNAKKVIKSSKKTGKEDPTYGVFKDNNLYIEYEQDTDLRDTERIPLNYNGGVEGFFKEEVIPYVEDAWIDESRTRIGYEISFTKYFYNPVKLRSLEEIVEDIKALEEQTDGLLDEIIGG